MIIHPAELELCREQTDKEQIDKYRKLWLLTPKERGQILKEQKEQKEKEQSECNHLKGGIAECIDGTYTGKILEDKHQFNYKSYAVLKHQFPWGDFWVRCLRCGKTWKPGDTDYKTALEFPTQNITSTSSQFKRKKKLGEGLAERARELTKES